jgi:hypothetical protein
MRKTSLWFKAIAALGLLGLPLHARAALSLFDNFNTYTPGSLSGQGGWTTSTTAGAVTNVVDVGGGDKEVQVYGNSIPNYKALGALAIPDASTAATVYFNFKMAAASTGNNFNFIITDVATPTDTAGTSEVQFNYDATQAPAGGSTTFRIRSGGSFLFASTGGTVASEVVPQANALYNGWFVINNSTDRYQLYLQSDADPALASPTRIFGTDGTGDFTFRNSAGGIQPNDLITANFGNGAATAANAVNYDDIYVDLSGQNLTNPVPEPAALGLCGLAVIGMLARRRKA